MAFEDLTQTEQIDQLLRATEAHNEAMRLMLAKIVEVAQHVNQHHAAINQLGRGLGMVEELLMGGPGE